MPFINKSEVTRREKDRKINGKCTNAMNHRSHVWPVYFIYLHRLQNYAAVCRPSLPSRSSILQDLDSQVSGLPKTISHLPSLTAFLSSSYSSPSPIAAAENPSYLSCSTWSCITETKGGTTTIEHISDFIAALASRGKS